MTPSARRKKRKDEIKVTIAPFRNLADYKTCEDIQKEVWDSQDIDIVPVTVLLEIQRTGGIVLGAYSGIGDLIGFECGIPGSVRNKPILHAMLLAVRSAYRNFDVGFKLMTALRKEALKRKLSLVTAAIDPMQPVQSYFALGKLGARSDRYEENYCGATTRQPDRGMPTDRLLIEWDLASKEVDRRLESGPPSHGLRKELKRQTIINQLRETAPGLVESSTVKLSCTEAEFLLEVPYNLPEIKSRDLGMAIQWQSKMRQTFRHYFKKDYSVTEFFVTTHDGHLRAFYRFDKNK
jgi:predicted GNAT superfamily acetyltransferase